MYKGCVCVKEKNENVSTHCGSRLNLYFYRTPHRSSVQLKRQRDMDAACN
ncbi:Hypothetical protein FKW44_007806 [Caligus rogercresseyi]|uniref:Uncharacterized protein n=1 Tax=Caligus rogercresseyi TaxID=217165 RepID=A0A7T8KF87_CALRO|nr:Hypothetical protein FKW44_007806 [Caligus rogercresseyi]